MKYQADIGVFGGSGFYSFLDNVEEITIETPYGPCSDKIALAKISNKTAAFLPRHGKEHQYPPAQIPYRANLWAMKELNVKCIIAPAACGSLQANIKPGDFVVSDQFVDRTSGRKDSFYEGPIATHVSAADPYCSQLRSLAIESAKELNITCHPAGTMVVIQGPRFSTRAESEWFTKMGWSVINMTGYPEVILARELEICYANISLVTDYDVGLAGMKPVSHKEVMETFKTNIEKVKKMILKMIEKIPAERSCVCGEALKTAR